MIIKRPFVWFFIMYVSSIYVSDNIYNKTYENAIIFLITLGVCVCVKGLLSNRLMDNKPSSANMKHNIGTYNCICVYICICFMVIGIYETVIVNNALVKEDINIETYVEGRVCGISSKENTYAVTLDVYKCREVIKGKVLAYIQKNMLEFKVGDIVLIKGNLNNFLGPTNPGQFNEYDYYVKQLKYSYKIYAKTINKIDISIYNKNSVCNLYYKLKNKLYDIRDIVKTRYFKLFDADKAGILSAMVLGEKSLINEEDKELYKRMGISHILAISGLHISMLGMLIFRILSKLKIHISVVNLITILFVICYGIMTDFSISTSRAVVMMIIMLISRIIGRSYDINTALSISGIIILMQNPLNIYNVGFLFSYGAIIGIIYVYPCIKSIIANNKVLIKNKDKIIIDKLGGGYEDKNSIFSISDGVTKLGDNIVDTIISGFSIYIITLPIMINSYYEITMYSILVNIIVLGTISMVIVISIVAIIASFFIYRIGSIIAIFTMGILEIYEVIGSYIDKINNNILIIGNRDMVQVLIYYSILIIVIYLANKKKKCIVLLILCLGIVIPSRYIKSEFFGGIQNKKYKDIEVTMLDVSQGDGICIETPNKKVITIDGGSSDKKDIDKYTIVPFLKYKGIDSIDYAIISHVDTDHISGIVGILKNDIYGIKINNIVLPYINNKSSIYKEIECFAKEKNVKVLYMIKGNELLVDKVSFKCLHPSKEYISDDENGYSTTIFMSYSKFNMLLTGDIGKEEELLLNEREDKLFENNEIEIIKVPHHGSKYSSSTSFLKKICPKYALISVGYNNMYGHPHKEVLDRYKAIGSKVYTTINSGAISISTDGKKMSIKEYKKGDT